MKNEPAGGARAGAFDVLTRVEEGGFANVVLDAYLEGPGRTLSRVDKGLLTELVTGVVKRRLTLDWIIDKLIHKQDKLQEGPRIMLRLGLYQLCYLDRIPARAATFETVELTRRRFHRGLASLVNGTLRSFLREKERLVWPDEQDDPVSYLSVCYSHPAWMVERWLARYGFEDARAFCQFNNEAPELWIRTNTLRTTREGLAEKLLTEGRKSVPGTFAPEALALPDGRAIRSLNAFREGLFAVQDQSSMLAAHGLGPAPGQRVLDACAAPGGKTTHLAQLMQDSGEIVAWDIHDHRVRLIRENQRRLGIGCIEASVRDAALAVAGTGAGADGTRGALFDRILVDAPCSGLGALRRRADARWNRKPEDLAGLARIQESILDNALTLLAPGGKLLYSTCTTEPEENRLLAEKVLASHPGCSKGGLVLPLLSEENRGLLPDPSSDWDIQFLPFTHGLEGFYMALIERNES